LEANKNQRAKVKMQNDKEKIEQRAKMGRNSGVRRCSGATEF